MAPLNRKGPAAPSFAPAPELDADALEDAIRGAEWVVDLRQRREFAAGHLPGTLNLELGVNLTTYLGWIVPWESDLVLLANDPAEIDEARRLIARIGRDELSGTALWGTAVPAAGRSEVCQEAAGSTVTRWQASRTLRRLVGPARRPGLRCSMSGTVTSGRPATCVVPVTCAAPGAGRAQS